MTNLRTIKIFLASSEELKPDREQFELFLSRQSNKYIEKEGIRFKLIAWENFLDAISTTCLQDEYNKKVEDCDIFVSLFKTKVGKYTEEEFDVALKAFRATGKPLIYTYFKNTQIDLGDITDEILTLINFKKRLQEIGHFYPPYTSIEDLKHRFREQIDKFLPEILDKQPQNQVVKSAISKIQKPQNKDFTEKINGILDLDMIFVKGGTFKMGGDKYENEQPIRGRKISDFYIGKYPVTIEQYMEFVYETKSNYPAWKEKGSQFNIKTGSNNDTYKKMVDDYSKPIVGVSWYNAVAYCEWLSEQTGKKYRLPSEAEWEYAARGGQKSRDFKYSGSNDIEEVAWYDENSSDLAGNHKNWGTNLVGLKKANELAIYDMSGNVWEWCQDVEYDYEDALLNGKAHEKGDTSIHIYRGGSWYSAASSCRIASRYYHRPSYRYIILGFRMIVLP